MIRLKRVSDKPGPDDGMSFLVERLWPRGIRKDRLHAATWLKDAAPSTELRKWFSHDPDKWIEFQHRYFAELNTRRDAWLPILEAIHRHNVTLLYSSHDEEYNSAAALKRYIERQVQHPAG